MDASENGNGAGVGTELKPLADARVYRMNLVQKKPYYRESFDLGLVGVGFRQWTKPELLEVFETKIQSKLKDAALRGLEQAYPASKSSTSDEAPNPFPTGRISVLTFGGLNETEAAAFVDTWLETSPAETNDAHQAALFLTARVGDIVIARDKNNGVYCGLFAAKHSKTISASPELMKPLDAGGHTCRPVSWVGSAKTVESASVWLTEHGFGNADAITKKNEIADAIVSTFNGTLKVYSRDSGKVGREKLDLLFPNLKKGKGAQTQPAGDGNNGIAGGGSLSARESPLRDLLQRSKSIILEGVPGTGKTYAIKNDICNLWEGVGQERKLGGKGEDHYAMTLHPATSYEDFVEGLRPAAKSDNAASRRPGPSATPQPVLIGTGKERASCEPDHLIASRYFHAQLDDIHKASGGFAVQDGFFLRVCAEAVNNPEKDYVVLLDEFNRCNVPKVMGDLLTTMERSKRAEWTGKAWDLSRCQVVTLPASKRLFFVPENVYVVATMNSTDRSVAPLDSALRRRFAFHRCWPMGFDSRDNLTDVGAKVEFVVRKAKENLGAESNANEVFRQSVVAWVWINELLKVGGPDVLLGHSYLMDLATDLKRESNTPKAALAVWVQHHWNHHILPQLADVLVTHSLDSRLVRPVAQDGKDGKDGNILTLKVGDRPIIQPPGMASSERGSHGTLVLQLKPLPPQDESAAVGSTQPAGAYVPKLLEKQGPNEALCGIVFHTVGGPGKAGKKRAAVVDLFWERLGKDGAPMPDSLRYARNGEFSDEAFWKMSPAGPGVGDLKKLVEDEAKRNQKAFHSYPWACYFESNHLVRVQALVEELGKPATSA